jgi:hypothetical protein
VFNDRKRLNIFVFVAVAIPVCWYVACGGKKPTEPKPIKDYPIYFSELTGTHKLFTLYPATGQIDSVPMLWGAREGISVSADGQRLYLADRNEIRVIDSEDKSLVTTLPYQPDDWIGISPDNQYIAIANGGLHVLRAVDYQPVFEDTIPVIHCEFSSNSKTLYCACKGTDLVYTVDLADSTYPVTLKEGAGGLVRYVVPTVDEAKLLLYVSYGTWISGFEVYDVARDSIIFRDVLVPGYGHLAKTPDDKYAFYTSPGRTATDPPPSLAFKVFDIQANAVDTTVEEPAFFSDSTWYAPPNLLAVTADSRRLAIIGGQMALSAVYLYDIKQRRLVLRKTPTPVSYPIYGNIASQISK